jgi:hypothetical protein
MGSRQAQTVRIGLLQWYLAITLLMLDDAKRWVMPPKYSQDEKPVRNGISSFWLLTTSVAIPKNSCRYHREEHWQTQ